MINTINPELSSRLARSIEELSKRDNKLDVSDFELLYTPEEIKSEKDLLKDFALGEYLAHGIAYKASQRQEGQRIFINEQDGIIREYTVQKIHSGHGGLVAEIFKPSGDNTTSTVYVNFTGTHNTATLHADVEYCPGEKTFQKHKSKLMSQINQVVAEVASKTNQSVNLVCAGHSLGAAYAQQCVTEVMRYQAHAQDFDQDTQQRIEMADKTLSQYLSGYRHIDQKIPLNNHFDKVNRVTLLTWNAAGVSKAIQNYSNQMADILDEQGINIKARFGMVGGDGVQLSGEGTVLSDCNADVANLKMDRGFEGRSSTLKSLLSGVAGARAGALLLGPIGAVVGGALGALIPAVAGATGTLSAHMAYHFPRYDGSAQIPSDIQYELLRNNTDEGHAKMKARLQNKSTILQSPIAHGGMYFLRKLGDLGAYIKHPFQSQEAVRVPPPRCKL